MFQTCGEVVATFQQVFQLAHKIEVRDSWTGYLVPARDGSGLLPDWESSWDVVVAAAVTWPGNYVWSFQIGFWLIWELSEFWYRGSTQNSEPDWSSIVIWLGEPLWKNVYLVSISQNIRFIVGGNLKFRNVDKHIQNVQMTISTISTYPKSEFSKNNPKMN